MTSTRPGICTAIALAALGAALAPPAMAQAPELPQSVATPPRNPQQSSEPETPSGADMQSDIETDADPGAEPTSSADQQALPSSPPPPSKRPERKAYAPAAEATEEGSTPATAPAVPPAVSRRDEPRPVQGPPLPPSLVGAIPADERACRAELKSLGVSFEEHDPESGENGCALPYPITTTNFGAGIAVEPPVLANCAVTLATAKFLQTRVKDAANEHLGAELTGIDNGSGYVCRPRRGTQKMSEHALGNAVDIMGFRLSGDRVVDVRKTAEEKEAAFLAAVRKAACGPFKTVLGPGSDSDHANHFHLDLRQRRRDGIFCQ